MSLVPAYQFADAGYDVWLMNARGNRYGMRHLSLDPEKDKLAFFNFTYLDISVFDCAAQIDYVIEHTGQPKVGQDGKFSPELLSGLQEPH